MEAQVIFLNPLTVSHCVNGKLPIYGVKITQILYFKQEKDFFMKLYFFNSIILYYSILFYYYILYYYTIILYYSYIIIFYYIINILILKKFSFMACLDN
jgi:hypothetical protein